MLKKKKYKNFYKSSHIKPSLFSIQEKINKITKKVIDNELIFNLKSTVVKALPCDACRTVVEADSSHLGALAIRNIILNTMLSAEATARGSGWILECHLSGLLLDNTKNQILKFSRGSFEDMQKVLSSNVGEGYINKIVNKIIEYSDFNVDIKCFSHEGNEFGIDIKSYKNFDIKIHDLFSLNNFDLEKLFFIYFDGQIEKIQEIEPLIKFLNKNEIKDCILVARNFHEDVISTLKINYNLKKFRIYPCVDILQDNSLMNYCKDNKDFLFVNLDNIEVFNSIDSDIELKEIKKISVKNNSIFFLDEKNNKKIKKDIKIFVPKKFEDCIGLIEDRIKYGVILSEQVCKSGVIKLDIDGKEFWTSIISYNTFIRSKNTLNNLLNNLGGFII